MYGLLMAEKTKQNQTQSIPAPLTDSVAQNEEWALCLVPWSILWAEEVTSFKTHFTQVSW